MILEYCLTENDYLQWTLYSASTSKKIKRQRIYGSLFIGVAFVFLALSSKGSFLFWYYLGFGLLIALLYPLYQRYYYKKQMTRRVAEIHRHNPFETSKLEFKKDVLEITGENEEAKFRYNTFDAIIQTGSNYFLKVKNGGALIIPKREIPDQHAFDSLVNSIAEKFSLEMTNEPNWKWK